MELIEVFLTGILEIAGFCVSKESRGFWSDVCGILAGRPVKNRPRDRSVC